MNLGVFDMIGLAASLVFAIPLANYAVIQLFAGQTALGAGLLVVAVAMVVLPQYFLDPGRILAGLIKGLLPRQLRGESSSDGKDAGTETTRDTDERTDRTGTGDTAVDEGGAEETGDRDSMEAPETVRR